MITPMHLLFLSGALFAIGLLALIARKHPIIVLLGIEIVLQAVNLALAALASWFQEWGGEVALLVIAILAAVELAVGMGAALAYTYASSWSREQRS
jgi:NADH-quinone oxidoreductase subunit K